MKRKFGWQTWLWSLLLALALIFMVRSDLSHLRWATKLSMEGSPAPARDPHSPTGYVLGQRQFLGTHERGTTYRWIEATQSLIASGPFASPIVHSDTVPMGRPRLIPKLYTFWLTAVAWGAHVITGDPIGLSVERAALWESVVLHVLAFIAVIAFMWIRYGASAAGTAGLFFVLFPPVVGQFLSGVLTPRTGAILLTAYAIALNLPRNREGRPSLVFSVRSAVVAGIVLWLDPALGFPIVLISAAAAAALIFSQRTRLPCFTWALIGSGLTVAAWLINQNPWNPAAGELRFVHPLYALAWLGIGLGLDAGQALLATDRRRKGRLLEIAAALSLIAPLAYTQLKHGYKGWLYTGATMRRLTSIDETRVYNNIFAWFSGASGAEIAFVLAPLAAAAVAIAVALLRRRNAGGERSPSLLIPAVLLAAIAGLAVFKVRWLVIAALVALPVLWSLASATSAAYRRTLLAGFAALFLGLLAWRKAMPAALTRPSSEAGPTPDDIEALIYRQFSHWLASHNPGQPIAALAPPELSDSLVFHGGCQVLMSTAWESYPGQVAASRILSAPESSEAEAVLQSRQITHVILPSWDKVLPLLVRRPQEADKTTLYARLQRWVFPRYLRPIPYHLPPVPGYETQKLVVFKVVSPQDEALSLSRLAEYFVEMDRNVPATLVAKVLMNSFPDDPNAAIARAIVAAAVGNQPEFDRELAKLVAEVKAGESPFSWDRRVQRAIVLAIGRRPDLARTEIAACASTASRQDLFELTPLEAYRLRILAGHFDVSFPDESLAKLLASLGSEYSAPTANAAKP